MYIICRPIYLHVCLCRPISVYLCMSVCVYTYLSMCVYRCMYMHLCMHVYIINLCTCMSKGSNLMVFKAIL